MSKSGKATRQNVRVICRVRPTNAREIREGGSTCVKCGEEQIDVQSEGGNNKFNFDRVFGMESTQVEVFQESAAPLIADVLAGYNATIFAYGQTGTGKTHTMEGDITSENGKGIIPRAVEALFQGVVESDENIEFTFRVSYVEIYLEKIRDLLDEHRTKTNLAIREDKLKGVYIAGVTEEYVTSVEELLQIMHVGAHNRATAATGMNEGSSRSHSVFTITVTQKDTQTNAQKAGKLVLVDLAGSEMVRKTGASGQQLEEAKMINKSLSALGQVINALTDDKATHVPYRDSKLTRVLQDSLGGNSKTVLIVAVSPSSFNSSETVSTLRFGMRAKSIENKVKINATRSVEELEALLVRAENAIDAQSTYIMSLTARLEALQSQLQQYQGQPLPPPQPVAAEVSSNREEGDGTEGEVKVKQVTVMPPNAVILEEGKVVVDVSRLEAEAAAIQKLQEEVFRLQQELDDERQDSQRKDGEISSLNRLLKDKERNVQELSSSVGELQRANDDYQVRLDTLLQEKITAVGELESVKASVSESTSKVTYQLQEMEVTLSTLQAENETLKREIAELSGEQQQPSSGANGPHKSGSPNKKNLINSDGVDHDAFDNDDSTVSSMKSGTVPSSASSAVTQPINVNVHAQHSQGTTSNSNSNSNNRRLSLNSATNPLASRQSLASAEDMSPYAYQQLPQQQSMRIHTDRKALLEQMADQFASLCLKHSVDDLVSAELFAVMDNYAVEAERSFALSEEKYGATEKLHSKRIKDLDEQRLRLQMDLQGRIENMIALQMRLDALTRHPVGASDPKEMAALLERDRAKQKSLQQRLEQLVAVHRQLLRKFATLELENVELKKKTILREERIKQLEDNSRNLVNNVRLQAEKHLAEVAIFREQISIMKIEFEKQYEAARSAEEGATGGGSGAGGYISGGANAGSGRSPGVVTRATLMNRNVQPKSIRGGGVGGKSFYGGAGSGGNDEAGAQGSGNNYNSLAATLSPSAMLSRYQSFSFGHFGGGNANNNASAAPPSSTATSASNAGNSTPVPSNSSAPAPMPVVMEEPRSMGLAARLLGQHK